MGATHAVCLVLLLLYVVGLFVLELSTRGESDPETIENPRLIPSIHCVVSVCLLLAAALAVATLLYGCWRERHVFLLPHVVLQVT